MGNGRRAAIAGFGRVAELAHAPALREKGVQVAAVAEAEPERRAAAARAFPDAALYADLDALLAAEKGLDFVDIATPPFLHASQALSVLKSGCSVLCEKPLALSEGDLDAVAAEAARAERVLWCVHNWAHAPQWRKIHELAASDGLGRLAEMDVHVLRSAPAAAAGPENWRRDPAKSGGGILIDHGWHNLYLIYRTLTPRERDLKPRLRVERVAGAPGAEDEMALSLDFGRTRAHLLLSWRAAERANRATLKFERGALDLEDDLLRVSGARREEFRFPEKLSQSSAHPAWFSALLGDFLAALDEPGSGAARENLAEAGFCVRTIAAAYALRREALAR
ncbi:MAG: Gfo/Idh/MocA family oxidoreductase [Elusimicrobia bacterium]|nr:Gfo/Idh/MocA family oxidoreductase [Elusimicrobiota bacterium]MDE2313326.1 Gfo/Idh/MocA family oxidoreductase [Elusimicrobiota bacterium]